MPIYRRDTSVGDGWNEIANIFRYTGTTWEFMNSIYRRDPAFADGWHLIYSRNLNIPVVTVAPVLQTQVGFTDDFTHTDTLTLDRGTWTRTSATYAPVTYNLSIQTSTSQTGPWTTVASGTGTTVSYPITIQDVRDPSYWFRGRVVVTNTSGGITNESVPYATTPVISRIGLAISSVTRTITASTLTVSWAIQSDDGTSLTNNSSNINSQLLEIITNTAYTYNGQTFAAGSVVYSTNVAPGTASQAITLSSTNIAPERSYYARVTLKANDTGRTQRVGISSDFTTLAPIYSFSMGTTTIYPDTNGRIGLSNGNTGTTLPNVGRFLNIYDADLRVSDARVWSDSSQYVYYFDGYTYNQDGVAGHRLTYMVKFFPTYAEIKYITRGSSLAAAKTIGIRNNGVWESSINASITSGATYRIWYDGIGNQSSIGFDEIQTSVMDPLGIPPAGADDGFYTVATTTNRYNPSSYTTRTLNTRTSTTLSFNVVATNGYSSTNFVVRTGSHSGTLVTSGSSSSNPVPIAGLSANTTYYITFTPVNVRSQTGTPVQFTETTSQAVGTIESAVYPRLSNGWIDVFFTTSSDTSVDSVTAYASRFYPPSFSQQTTSQVTTTGVADGGKRRGNLSINAAGQTDYANSSYPWTVYLLPKLGADTGTITTFTLPSPPTGTADFPTATLGTPSTTTTSFTNTVTLGGLANRYTLDVKTGSYNGTSIAGYPRQNQSGNISVSGLTTGTTYYVQVTPYYYYYNDPDHTVSNPSNSVRYAGATAQFTATPSSPIGVAPIPGTVTFTPSTTTFSIPFTAPAGQTIGPFYQTYWLTNNSAPSNTQTAYDAASTSSPMIEVFTPIVNSTYYFWLRSSNQDLGNTTVSGNATPGTFSNWSSSTSWGPGTAPSAVSVSISPSTGTAGTTTYTATPSASGFPAPTFTYQWRYRESSTIWPAIPNATSSTYSPPSNFASLYFSDTIRCDIVATNFFNTTGVTAQSGSAIVNAPAVAPTNATLPTLSPTTITVGTTLSAGIGTWNNNPTNYDIRIYRGTQFVSSGETLVASRTGSSTANLTYPITQADYDSGQRYFRTFVNASNTAGSSGLIAGQERGPTGLAPVSPPVNTVAPSVTPTSGTTTTTFSCTTGSWSNSPTSYSYQWQYFESPFGWVSVSGQTSSTWLAGSFYAGVSIRCRVTATNSGGSATADSNSATVSSGVTLPGTPTIGSVSGSGSVSWTPPTTGGAVASYEIEFFTASSSAGANAAGPYTVTGIPGSPYQLTSPYGGTNANWARARVRARNAAGAGNYSAWAPSATTYA